jgi:MSHA pilin protein MshD
MEEVLLKPFTVTANDVATPARNQFNDVRDYDGSDDANPGYSSAGIRNIDGDPVVGLEGYQVSVRINKVALNGIPAADTLRVIVTVTRGDRQLALTGWRTNPEVAP